MPCGDPATFVANHPQLAAGPVVALGDSAP